MKLLREDLHTLTGVYALDAIDGNERSRFEHHLRRCQSCDNEVRGLRDTATQLAVAVARVPPPELKPRILAAAARTRQLPPPAAERSHRARRSWVPRLAGAVGAVGLAAAIVLGFAWSSAQRQLDHTRAQNQAITAVLTAPGARIETGHLTVGGTATVVVSTSEKKLIFTADGLPALPSAKVYQLWLIGTKQTRSAGLLPAAAAGRTPPVLAAGLLSGDRVGVTIEPAGGTAQPTTTPILVMSLPAR